MVRENERIREELDELRNRVSIGDIIPFGGWDWRVLDVQDGRALILSENIIELRAYHYIWEDVTWETSDIRAYLNGEFLNTFSGAERARVAETAVINDDNPWDFGEWGGNANTPGGANTTDRVFLLSLDEVVRYFGDSGRLHDQNHINNEWWGFSDQYNEVRIARIDDDATIPEELTEWFTHGAALWWWLRSPGDLSYLAADVLTDGTVYVRGNDVSAASGGVAPLCG